MPNAIKIAVLAVITISIIATIGFVSPPNDNSMHTQSNLQAYVNPVYGMKILYPSQWQTFQMGKGDLIVGFISYPQNESGILDSVVVQTIDYIYYNLPLQDIAQKELNIYRSELTGFSLNSASHSITSQGLPIYVMEYSHQGTQGEIKTMEILVKNTNNIYKIVYDSDASEYSKFLSQVEHMIDTMVLTHSEHAQQITNYYRHEEFISL